MWINRYWCYPLDSILYLVGENEMEKPDEKYLSYLDVLRESGITNMYGAAPYLCETFDIDKKEAVNILLYWMNTYTDKKEKI